MDSESSGKLLISRLPDDRSRGSKSLGKTAIACEPCRRKRVRCDGVKPFCGRCSETNESCVYALGRRHRARETQSELVKCMNTHRELLARIKSQVDQPTQAAIQNLLDKANLSDQKVLYSDLPFSQPVPNIPILPHGGDNSSSTDTQDDLLEIEEATFASLDSQNTDGQQAALQRILDFLRSSPTTQAESLVRLIRSNSTLRDILSYVDGEIGGEGAGSASLNILASGSKRKAMDLNRLIDAPLYDVPAHPWTILTDDDELVSHLISLYFTWEHPFYQFVDRDLFLEDMGSGKVGSQFCSPLLVNSLLALASHFSDHPGAFANSQDPATRGDHFYAEARRLWEAEEGKVTLVNLQALCGLMIASCMKGKDRVGLMMLKIIGEMYQELGFHRDTWLLPPGLNTAMEDKLERARKVTAWGCFNAQAMFTVVFLRPSEFHPPGGGRPYTSEELEIQTLWQFYPTEQTARPTHLYYVFDSLCDLMEITFRIQDLLFPEADRRLLGADLQNTVDHLFTGLSTWHEQLPPYLDIRDRRSNPTPCVLDLHLAYHIIVICLYGFLRRPKLTPPNTPSNTDYMTRANELCIASAREIAFICNMHRRQYTLDRNTSIMVQATSISVFTLMTDLDSAESRTAFIDVCNVLRATGRRHMFARGLMSMIQPTADQIGIQLPPEIQRMLGEFVFTSWKEGDYQRFSSAYPNYAVIKVASETEATTMSDLLEKWATLSLAAD